MKKLIAVLMALTVLFSFAMADTQTDLQPAPAAEPAAEPASAADVQPAADPQPAVPEEGAEEEEEAQVVNFREMMEEEALAQGEYARLGELPLQIWIPTGKFTVKEIPDDPETYADAILVLSWNANPDYEIIVNYGETDVVFADYLADLENEEDQDVISSVAPAKVNGFDAVSFIQENEDGAQFWLADYFTGDACVEFIFPIVEDDDDFEDCAAMIGSSLEAIEE